MYEMNGYQGDWHNRGWGHRGGWGRRRHPFFFFPALLLVGFLFFGLFKFFLPLIALGFIFMGVRALMHGGFGGHGGWEGRGREFWNQRWNWENEWSEKRKHDWMSDEKPKRDDSGDEPRYTRAPNGDWVEII